MRSRNIPKQLVVALVAVALGLFGAAFAQTTMRLAHISPAGSPADKGAQLFANLVNQGTNGKYTIKIYPNSQLGSAPEYTQQIKLGTLAMGLVTSGQMQEYVKQYGIIEAPFLFSSLQQAHKVLDGPAGDQLAALAKQQGFIILSNWEWGFRQITNSVRPIQEPADMKGLKMRVPSEFQIQDMMKALGASTDTIAFPELYTALAQKVVDGQDNPVQTIFDQHFYEVQKYLAITNHAYNTQMLVMSQHAWNSLSAQEQQVFMNASKRAGDLVRNLDEQQQSSEITQMQQKGMVVTHPDLAAFRKAVQPADQQVYDYVGDAFAQKFVAEVEAAAGQ
jgi:TRAP-type transport system periplasmic protein